MGTLHNALQRCCQAHTKGKHGSANEITREGLYFIVALTNLKAADLSVVHTLPTDESKDHTV